MVTRFNSGVNFGRLSQHATAAWMQVGRRMRVKCAQGQAFAEGLGETTRFSNGNVTGGAVEGLRQLAGGQASVMLRTES